MSTETEADGRKRAQEDWDRQRSRYQVVGTLPLDEPLLGQDRPFYPASSGCEDTDERAAFCRSYNETLDRLVEQFGVPDWAPGRRMPNREEALDLIARLGSPTPPALPGELRRACDLIAKRRQRRGISTARWAFVSERKVVLLGGDLSPRAGTIDVIDAEGGLYMASYEYRRRHVPKLPWDPESQ